MILVPSHQPNSCPHNKICKREKEGHQSIVCKSCHPILFCKRLEKPLGPLTRETTNSIWWGGEWIDKLVHLIVLVTRDLIIRYISVQGSVFFFWRIIARFLLFLKRSYRYKGKKGGQIMKVRWKEFGDGWDGPKGSRTTVPIHLSKP